MDPRLRHLFAGSRAPTLDEVLEISRLDSMEPGVYAHVLAATNEVHKNHVYIGLASSIEGGLRLRNAKHEAARVRER